MKKLFGVTVAMMLGISMIGCESTDLEDTNMEQEETKQEEQVEEPKDETKEEAKTEPEEVVEDTVLTMEDETFKYYMTTNLTDEEYAEYFKSITFTDTGVQEIEFDGQILMVNPSEKYSTRSELLLATGDYNDGNFVGPYIKTRDIANTSLKGMIAGQCNVKVKATIEEYDQEKGWLKINVKEIEAR